MVVFEVNKRIPYDAIFSYNLVMFVWSPSDGIMNCVICLQRLYDKTIICVTYTLPPYIDQNIHEIDNLALKMTVGDQNTCRFQFSIIIHTKSVKWEIGVYIVKNDKQFI